MESMDCGVITWNKNGYCKEKRNVGATSGVKKEAAWACDAKILGGKTKNDEYIWT